MEKSKSQCWEGRLGNKTSLGILLQVCCTVDFFFFFLRGSFLKENTRHKDYTPAYRIRLIIQEHKVKYLTKGLLLILICLLLSEK